jgi:Flp pilus assembly protein TadD
MAREDLPGAVKTLEEGLKTDLREPAGRKELEAAHADYLATQERLGQLTAAITSSPQDARSYLDLASLLSGAGASEKAVEAARRAAELSPDTATRARLGYYLVKAGHSAEAVTVLKELGEEAPPASLLNLGVAQASLGQDDAAVASYRQYVTKHPKDPLPYLYLGNSLFRLGKPQEARAAYQSYLDLSSEEKAGKVRRLLQVLTGGEATP